MIQRPIGSGRAGQLQTSRLAPREDSAVLMARPDATPIRASLCRVMSRTRRRMVSLTLLLCAWIVLHGGVAQGSAVAAGNPVAQKVIERFEAVLLEMMRRADELGYQGRLELVSPARAEAFDLVFMARKTIGRYWKELDEQDQARWLATFEAFIDSNFADRFDGFNGEAFEIVGQKPASQNTLVVLTKLIRPEHDDVELNYRMREAGDTWKVVDIYSGGKVSEVALRRSEFAALLKEGGIEKLIESVSEKTRQQAEKQ